MASDFKGCQRLVISKQQILWLEEILSLYVAPDLEIKREGDDYYCIVLKDSDERVFCQIIPELWEVGEAKFGCVRWSPESEGYQSILEEDIPAPGLNKAPDLMIETIQNGVRVNYDILGLTYCEGHQ
jgi:hypothetical protein